MQNVVYGEYLPTVLGVDYMQRHGLIVEEETRYDDSGPDWRYNPYNHVFFNILYHTSACFHIEAILSIEHI